MREEGNKDQKTEVRSQEAGGGLEGGKRGSWNDGMAEWWKRGRKDQKTRVRSKNPKYLFLISDSCLLLFINSIR